MAILHADNFSIYGSNQALMLNGVYAFAGGGSLDTDPDGVSSGRVYRNGGFAQNNYADTLRYVLQNGAVTTLGISVRVWLPHLPFDNIATPYPMVLRTTGNGGICSVTVLSNGALAIQGENRTIMAETAVPVLTANGWYHIEGKFTIKNGGTVDLLSGELRVEGRTVLTLVDYSIPKSAFGQFVMGNSNNTGVFGPSYYVKDFVIWDSGGTVNKDFLGSVIVTTLTIDNDVSLNWVPSTGTTGSAILDNIPPVDGQYISAEDSPIPAPYQGSLTNLPAETTSVRGLVTFVRAGKSDGGDGSLKVSIVSSPGNAPAEVGGEDRPITVAQTYWRDIFEIDPKTSAPWLPATVNGVNIKINRTT